ncbi:oligosaccharide flippase family protein [Bacillus sp. PAMC26568]|nr:oligosaccharide flippase family protein [Bacillus sp. PAMC26568]
MNGKQLKVAAFLSYTAILMQNGINLVFTPFLLRIVGKAEYGLYALIGSFVGYLTMLDFGIGNTVTRYISQYKEQNKKKEEENLIAICLLIYAVISIIILFIGVIIHVNLDVIFRNGLTANEVDRAKIMFALLLVNVILSLPVNIFNAVMQGYEKFIVININSIIRAVLAPVVITILLLIGYKTIAIIVVNTILNMLLGIFNTLYVMLYLKLKPKLHFLNRTFIKELFHYSFFVFLGAIVDQIYWRTGQVILGMKESAASVAVYSIAIQFCMYYMTFSTVISGMLFPRINQLVARKASNEELSNFFAKTGRIQLLILGFILGEFIIVGRDFIIIWAGQEYENAWIYSLIIMLPLTIPLIQNTGIGILQAKNKQVFRSLLYLAIALINLVASFLLVEKFGSIGISLITSVCLIFGNIIIINLYYHHKIKLNIIYFLRYNFKSIFFILGSILLSLVIIKNEILVNEYLNIILKGFIFCCIYLLIIWTWVFNKQEKQKIIRRINKG